jgi:membrane-anchored mycosin MYCP
MPDPESAPNYPSEQDLIVSGRHAEMIAEILGTKVKSDDALGSVTGLCRIELDGRDVKSALELIRTRTREQHGWVPTVGRNRVIEVPVEGQPQDSIGTGDAIAAGQRLADRQPGDMRGCNVRIGIVDGKIWRNPWFGYSVLAGLDDIVVDQSELDTDHNHRLDRQAGHATFCSGLALQHAPAATVTVDSALNTFGRGSTADVIAASVRLARAGVNILSLSLGCRVDDGFAPAGFIEMLQQINPELVIVAAAGNLDTLADDTYEAPHAFFPAAFDSVVAVAAAQRVERDGEFTWTAAPFSNRGPWVDCAAPGVDVLSTFVEYDPQRAPADGRYHEWAAWSGTSHATAIVAGTIAAAMTEHNLTARQAVTHLKANARHSVTFDAYTVPLLGESTQIYVPVQSSLQSS